MSRRKNYLSINLRRLDNITNHNEDFDQSLELRIKYFYYTESQPGIITENSGYIKFDSVPISPQIDDRLISLDSTTGYHRGRVQNMMFGNGADKIIITKGMLPKINDTLGRDITIRGSFLCGKFKIQNYPTFNYELATENNAISTNNDTLITKMQVEIRYLGTGNPTQVAIDWIRLETPNTLRFLEGEFDDLITSNIQTAIDTFVKSDITSKNIKLHRLDPFVEVGFQEWLGWKYYTELVGNIVATENGTYMAERFNHLMNPPTVWYSLAKVNGDVPAPYSRRPGFGNEETFHLGVRNGYTGWKQDTFNYAYTDADSIECHYEDFLSDKSYSKNITFFRDNPDSLDKYNYMNSIDNNHGKVSWLSHFEYYNYKVYFDENEGRNHLFNDNIWWAQFFIHNWYHGHISKTNHYIYPNEIPQIGLYSSRRPVTSSELRAYSMSAIMLGAKGLLFDGAETGQIGDAPNLTQMSNGPWIAYGDPDSTNKVNDLMNKSSFDYLSSDLLGSDFYTTPNDIPVFDGTVAPLIGFPLTPLDTLAKFHDRPANKIFMGRKSQRFELRKLYMWIDDVQDTLLNLKLQSHLAFGYKKWYQQHPQLTKNLLQHFISENSIRTKHPSRNDYEGTHAYNFQDSSFYDIMIHADSKHDPNMDSVYNLGILNRRTNPLIREDINGIITPYFYSGYEWDYFTDTISSHQNLWGSKTYTKEEWRTMYRNRMGCREISIMLNDSIYDINKQYLSITELGNSDNDSIGYGTDWQWWRKDRWDHRTDITHDFKDSLKIELLPGEGKFLRVALRNVFDVDYESEYGCDICDYTDQFIFKVIPDGSCCYSIEIEGNTNCEITTPIFIRASGTETGNITWLNSSISGQFASTQDSLTSVLDSELSIYHNTFKIGDICIADTLDDVTIDIGFGNYIDGTYVGCDLKSNITLPTCKDCCSLIESMIISSRKNTDDPIGGAPISYFNGYTIPDSVDLSCFENVDVQFHDGSIKSIVPDTNATIAQDLSGKEIKITSYYNGYVGNDTIVDIKFLFRDSQDNIICEKTVQQHIQNNIGYDPQNNDIEINNDSPDPPPFKQGVYQNDKSALFAIVPNPNQGNFEIKFGASEVEFDLIEIVDITGKLILSRIISPVDQSIGSLFINSELNNGAYSILIYSDAKIVTTLQLLIDK